TGTAAAQVLAAAAEGLSREQILQRYSALTEEDVAAVFEAAALAFHGEPDLVLPPLPLRLDISGSAATGGLVVNVAAEVDGSDVILTARDLLESDDGIRVGHRHWRLARNDARILRLLVDRGRQDGRGRLLIRPEITPEVLPVLRRRPNARE